MSPWAAAASHSVDDLPLSRGVVVRVSIQPHGLLVCLLATQVVGNRAIVCRPVVLRPRCK